MLSSIPCNPPVYIEPSLPSESDNSSLFIFPSYFAERLHSFLERNPTKITRYILEHSPTLSELDEAIETINELSQKVHNDALLLRESCHYEETAEAVALFSQKLSEHNIEVIPRTSDFRFVDLWKYGSQKQWGLFKKIAFIFGRITPGNKEYIRLRHSIPQPLDLHQKIDRVRKSILKRCSITPVTNNPSLYQYGTRQFHLTNESLREIFTGLLSEDKDNPEGYKNRLNETIIRCPHNDVEGFREQAKQMIVRAGLLRQDDIRDLSLNIETPAMASWENFQRTLKSLLKLGMDFCKKPTPSPLQQTATEDNSVSTFEIDRLHEFQVGKDLYERALQILGPRKDSL